MPGPKFGILTTTHEGTYDYLPYCIETVQEQARYEPDHYTYLHVIVNDGCERTRNYLNTEAECDPHILPVHLEENQGQTMALKAGELALMNISRDICANEGIPVTQTYPNYFLIVDGDDGLTPNALLDYSNAALEQWRKTRTIPGIMFGQATIIDEHGQQLDDVPHMPGYNKIPDTTDIDSFLIRMNECNHLPSKPAIRWELFNISGIPCEINGDRVTCADWLLALNGLKHCNNIWRIVAGYVHIPTSTSYYRVRSGQSSFTNSTNGTWERERAALVEGHFDPFTPMEPLSIEEWGDEVGHLPGRQ
jgi:hypothetical protein